MLLQPGRGRGKSLVVLQRRDGQRLLPVMDPFGQGLFQRNARGRNRRATHFADLPLRLLLVFSVFHNRDSIKLQKVAELPRRTPRRSFGSLCLLAASERRISASRQLAANGSVDGLRCSIPPRSVQCIF